MPREETQQHTYHATWRDVFLASWLKYPSPIRPDVLSVDIIKKDFDPETGILKATRLIMVDGMVPNFLKFVFGPSQVVYFVEESTINVKEKAFIMNTKNISYSNLLQSEERCTYTIHPDNADWTKFEQSFCASIKTFFCGVANKAEEFCIETAKKQSQRVNIIFFKVINSF